MDGIEQDYAGRLLVIRLNIQEDVGSELAPLFGLEFSPTFIFFDAQATELWRSVGDLDLERLRQSLE